MVRIKHEILNRQHAMRKQFRLNSCRLYYMCISTCTWMSFYCQVDGVMRTPEFSLYANDGEYVTVTQLPSPHGTQLITGKSHVDGSYIYRLLSGSAIP